MATRAVDRSLTACLGRLGRHHTPDGKDETDRVGFEPTIPVRVYRFSRPAPSATRAPVQRARKIKGKRAPTQEPAYRSPLPLPSSLLFPLLHRGVSARAQAPGVLHHTDELLPVTVLILAASPTCQRQDKIIAGGAFVLRVPEHHSKGRHSRRETQVIRGARVFPIQDGNREQ